LLIAQALVLVAGAGTTWLVAAGVGPGIFSDHLHQAGVSHTASETAHVEEAFASALIVALVVALLVSISVALAVTWFFTRRVQRSVIAVADSASRIARGEYRSRVRSPGLGTEFDLLTRTINRLAERLETVEHTRRRMLSDLAHEMRTPLATIDAYLEAIEDGVRDADTQTITLLRSSTDRLGQLARDIGAVSRAEEGQLEVHPEPVPAADLVRAAITAAHVDAENKQVALREQIDTDATVLADPGRMGQVLGNLIDNAVRHSPAGSKIVVSCRRSDRHSVDLAVTDTGDGIAAEHLAHVFDRFYRADTARNRAQGGSGIGLTITRAIVEAHGGRISAASQGPGHGSTFIIHLPAG
jgi:signal transduction histidine kinase